MNTPLVSVLMAAYNSEKYIAEAIESVLASSYSNFELIICDDRSTDNTGAIAKSYAKIDNRISIYTNEKNLGDYPNRNRVASYAKGKYLKYLDHDDVLYKYSLDYMVEAMEKYSDAVLGISFSILNDEMRYPNYNSPAHCIRTEFLGVPFLGSGPSSAIISRDAFVKSGGFLEKDFVGDQELWLRLAKVGGVVKLQPSLNWYRIHEAQESNRERKSIVNQHVRYLISLDILELNKEFFSEKEIEFIIKKIKRNQARNILKSIILDKKLKDGIELCKKCKLSFFELLNGFKPFIK